MYATDNAWGSGYNDYGSTAFGNIVFVYITIRKDALKLDPSRGIGKPVTLPLRTQVWSWLKNDNLSK
jgi:hypothetical protein